MLKFDLNCGNDYIRQPVLVPCALFGPDINWPWRIKPKSSLGYNLLTVYFESVHMAQHAWQEVWRKSVLEGGQRCKVPLRHMGTVPLNDSLASGHK